MNDGVTPSLSRFCAETRAYRSFAMEHTRGLGATALLCSRCHRDFLSPRVWLLPFFFFFVPGVANWARTLAARVGPLELPSFFFSLIPQLDLCRQRDSGGVCLVVKYEDVSSDTPGAFTNSDLRALAPTSLTATSERVEWSLAIAGISCRLSSWGSYSLQQGSGARA